MRKIASLGLLFATTAPALAEPDTAETLAYIKARCDVSHNTGTETLSLFGSGMLIYSYDYPGTFTSTTRVPFRRVEIRLIPNGEQAPRIQLYCGDACMDYRSWGKVTKNENRKETRLNFDCRDPERVIKALKHLQTLLGGQIVDPFAD